MLAVAGLLAGCAGEPQGAGRGVTFASVSAGRLHTCAVTDQRDIYCWGHNEYGALGDSTTSQRSTPVRVHAALAFQSVSAGFDYTCALTTAAAAYCWGANFNGQLGDGTTINRLVPVPVEGGLQFREIAAGEAHTCAVSPPTAAYCWGAPLGPDPDGGILPIQLRPVRLTLGFATVSSGYEISCAVSPTGAVYCWGQQPPGVVISDTSLLAIASPAPVANGVSLASVSAGHKHACGLAPDGHAYCWGRNTSGQLGDSTTTDRLSPVPLAGAAVFASLTAHAPSHSCGIDGAGTALCWGQNSFGQLGNGTRTSSTVPAPVAESSPFVSLSVGFAHTCGVTVAGTALCWGSGGFGQLGTGAAGDTTRPVAVAP